MKKPEKTLEKYLGEHLDNFTILADDASRGTSNRFSFTYPAHRMDLVTWFARTHYRELGYKIIEVQEDLTRCDFIAERNGSSSRILIEFHHDVIRITTKPS